MADANSPATPSVVTPELSLASKAPTPVAAPVVVPVAAAPTEVSASASESVVAPAAAPVTPVSETAPVAPAQAADLSPSTTASAPEPAKPAEPVAAEPAKPVAPIYTEFKLPKEVKADPATLTAFQNTLAKYNLSQEAGQELVNFHANAVRQASDAMAKNQIDVFEKTKADWNKSAQREFGNRYDTTVEAAKWAISQFGGSKKEIAELNSVLNFSGTGNHPALIRAFANIAKKMREREAPPAGLRATKSSESPAERRYGKSNGNGARA